MITRDLRSAIGRAVVAAGYGAERDAEPSAASGPESGVIPDPGLRPGGRPGQYASSAAFEIARYAGQPPGVVAGTLADKLRGHDWIEDAAATGPGYVTITVTPSALSDLARRITEAGPDCARGDALAGVPVTAPVPGTWETASTWDEARDRLHAEITATLAEAAGATVSAGGTETTTGRSGEKATEVGTALAFAGTDAVRFFLARALPEQSLAVNPAIIARHVPANPAYAVRYAHARAASGVRWAVALGTPKTCPQRPPADHGELTLLDALSWLPERVATAARRHRPDEFARYLERVADITLDTLTSPAGGKVPGSDKLDLARAARTGLAAGLTLLGVSAPDRL